MKIHSKETFKKWIKYLNEIKQELDNNNCRRIGQVLRAKPINHSWHGFLRKNKIIYKENGFYKWNNKIPISNKLIDKFREHQTSIRYNKQFNLFDMPQTPLPKPPKVIKTRTPKVEVKINQWQKSELGVIRKFFKLLWLGVIRKFFKWLW